MLGEIRHKDLLVIGDAGLPVPKGVERIDLGWKQGSPGYLEVLEEIAKVLVIESATFAEECHSYSPDFHAQALKLLPEGAPVNYVPHVELKKISEGAKAIILTGEFTPYTNIVITAGCAY